MPFPELPPTLRAALDERGYAEPTPVQSAVLAPETAGRYVHEHVPGATFTQLTATGHCPHLSAPEETTAATGSGDIKLDLRNGRATLRTGTGDVVVRVPREVPVWLDLNTGLGDVTRRINPVGPPAQGQEHLSVSVRSGTGDILITH